MGIVGIEWVVWIIYCDAQTYRAKSQCHVAHGRDLEDAIGRCTPIARVVGSMGSNRRESITRPFLSSIWMVARWGLTVHAECASVVPHTCDVFAFAGNSTKPVAQNGQFCPGFNTTRQTLPHAPRLLVCARLGQYRLSLFALSALCCEAPTHLFSVGPDSNL